MLLFDQIERVDDGPILYTEPASVYLNRSARPIAAAIRQMLESWFSHYPYTGQAELCKRLRSRIDTQHQAAFFELFLHEMLLKLGYTVELHPKLSKSVTTQPDFVVTSPNEQSFYIEAVLATDESTITAAARARMSVLCDGINRKLSSRDFFISMDTEGLPNTPPPIRKIVAFLEEKIGQIDPDEVAASYKLRGFIALPRWVYQHEGWLMEFYPIPKAVHARGKPNVRPLGSLSSGAKWMNSQQAIRDAIIKKAGRYGELDLPYVIAVNALCYIDHSDIMEALFGKEQFHISFSEAEPQQIVYTEVTRKLDGAWTTKSGPRYTRVSAVLIANQLLPWNLPRATMRLYHNPWAQKPLMDELTQINQAIPENGEMKLLDRSLIQVICDFPTEWSKSEDNATV